MPPRQEPPHGRRSTDADLAVIVQRLDDQDKMLTRIFEQTARTNARVTALEIAKATEEAVSKDRTAQLAAKAARTDAQRTRKAMLLSGSFGMFSGIVGYTFMALAHIHP